jgi:hypothetical protein
MGKDILLEAQKHLDNAMDVYTQHYGAHEGVEDPELYKQLSPPEAVDSAMTKIVMRNIGMHGSHNSGRYQEAHNHLGAIHRLLHTAGKNLPTDDSERAYPVYQAFQRAKSAVNEAGEKYANLMTTEPPRE